MTFVTNNKKWPSQDPCLIPVMKPLARWQEYHRGQRQTLSCLTEPSAGPLLLHSVEMWSNVWALSSQRRTPSVPAPSSDSDTDPASCLLTPALWAPSQSHRGNLAARPNGKCTRSHEGLTSTGQLCVCHGKLGEGTPLSVQSFPLMLLWPHSQAKHKNCRRKSETLLF